MLELHQTVRSPSRLVARWSVMSAIAIVAAAPVRSARPFQSSFVVGDVSVVEPDTGSTAAVLTVSMPSFVAHGDIALSYSTRAETAAEGAACFVGVDYVGAHNQPLIIKSGQNSARITVRACGDMRFEPNETFAVLVLNATGLEVQAKGRVTIIENDPPPVTWGGMTAEGKIAKAQELRWQTPILRTGTYTFTLGNLTGDADLYIRVGAPPTVSSYSCRPAKSSADETCAITLNSVSDVIYIMVRGYATSSTFTLTGSAQ